MAKFMQSRRKMLIAAGEAIAVGALGYFGLKYFLSSDKEDRGGPKLKVVFVLAPDGLGTANGGPGLWHPIINSSPNDSQDFTLRAISNELAAYKRSRCI